MKNKHSYYSFSRSMCKKKLIGVQCVVINTLWHKKITIQTMLVPRAIRNFSGWLKGGGR